MEDKNSKIERLENEAAEYAKEILLNEVAIQDAQRMIAEIEAENWETVPEFLEKIEELQAIIRKLHLQNNQYKVEVFKKEFEIKKLNEESNETE